MKHLYKIIQTLLLVLLCSGAMAQYCLPTYSTGCTYGDGLTLFQLGTINQTITCTASYHDFTASSTNLTIGNTYTLTVQAGYSGTDVNVYIDYNHNNVFDGTELIGQVNCTATGTNFTITFTVPGTALTGSTRIRALTEWYAYPGGPCTAQTYGNCEDFTVNLLSGSTPPTVNTAAATAITATTATLNGSVNANGSSTAVTFQYGLTVAYGSTITAPQSPVTGATLTSVTGAATGLIPNTLYHYRCVGVNAGGTTNGSDMTFTTPGAPPTMVTNAATAITGTTATFNGTANANNNSTNVSFDFGPTIAYGFGVAGTPTPVTGSSVTPITGTVTGLLPNTLYHFRANGINTIGPTYGNDVTFTTLQIPPAVTTTAATGVNSTIATVNGTVNANNLSTSTYFDYGLTVAYGSVATGVPTTVTGTTTTSVSANLTALATNTLYHYRIRCVNAAGTTNGGDMTFTTVCNTAGSAGAISGASQVCNGGTGYVYSVAPITNANSYSWTIPFGAIITAGANTNSITVSYPNPSYSGNIFVNGVGCAGNGTPSNIVITVNAAATPTLTGPATTCVGSTGNVYTTQAGMANYIWNVSAGGVITAGGTVNSNTVTVTWITAGTQCITVNYNNATGCAGLNAATYCTMVNPLPSPTIAGNANPCTMIPTNYNTEAGMSNYIWSCTGGSISFGGNSNAPNVTWNTTGPQNLCVTYTNNNGCANSTPACTPITVKQGPTPTISGSGIMCVNSGYYTYTTEAGMTGYTWNIPSGGTIVAGGTTNTATVTWTAAGTRTISVNYTNGNGCAAPAPVTKSVIVTDIPGQAGTISGPSTVCEEGTGYVYSVAAIPNTHSYIWTLPTGATITSGLYSNSITVSFAQGASSGNITVYGNNTCGNGTVSAAYPVTVNLKPTTAGTISGPIALCQGSTGMQYTVAPITGATGYSWTLPAGASIVGGANTNSITVDFSSSAVSGTMSVYGTNTCGNGGVSPSLSLTILVTPQTPVITSDGIVTLTSDAPSGNQWYLSGSAIAGATNQTYEATVNGLYSDIVTINGCSSLPSNTIDIVNVGVGVNKNSGVSVYPVPNDGKFTVSISSPSNESFTLSVLNSFGVEVYHQECTISGTVDKVVDLRPTPSGIYTMIIRNSLNQIIRKIIVNK